MLLPSALGFSPHPPVSVYSTGTYKNNSGFSRHMAHILRYFYFAPHHVFGLPGGFASLTPLPFVPVFPFPAYAFHMRPHSSVYMWYRNLNLLSIGYVFRPLLRPRLTQSRSVYSGNLRYSAGRIPTFLSLLIPAFSLLIPPLLLPVQLRRF